MAAALAGTALPPPAASVELRPAAQDVVDNGVLAGIPDIVEYVRMRDAGACSCAFLKTFLVGPLRAMCAQPDVCVDTTFEDSKTRKRKHLAKPLLLLRLCAKCETVEDVANANYADVEGVGHHCWVPPVPDQAALHVCDAYHMYIMEFLTRHHPDPASPIRYELNRFRAHTLKHLRTNWTYYVTKGRQNKADGKFMHCYFMSR